MILSLCPSVRRCLSQGRRLLGHTAESKHKFDKESTVSKVSDNIFKSFVSDSWSIGDAPNGGYLMTLAISAARQCIPFRDPFSVTAYYLTKTAENAEVDISVDVLGTSKSSSTVQITMMQSGVIRSRYLGVFGDLSTLKGLNYSTMKAPDLPPIEKCLDATAVLRKAMGPALKISNEIDFRISKNSIFAKSVLGGGRKVDNSGPAVLDAWVAFEGGRGHCLRTLSFFCDALPPPVLNITSSNWVPTLEYTVNFWERPSFSHNGFQGKHWLRARFSTNHVRNSMLFTDGELWSEDGNILLATSRQYARVLLPRN